jgi:hypothetical protein
MLSVAAPFQALFTGKFYSLLERHAKDKRSSLPCISISVEVKQFSNFDFSSARIEAAPGDSATAEFLV